MTTQQVILWTCGYLVELIAVAYFARASSRRLAGALAGGVVVGVMEMGAIVFFQALGLWQVPFTSAPWFLPLFYLGCVVSLAPIYLLTWRVSRRFGGRGLAVSTVLAAVIGPPRDYFIASRFPKWMVFSPGLAPILADSATYAGIVALGHGVMRLVAGHSGADPLMRLPIVGSAGPQSPRAI